MKRLFYTTSNLDDAEDISNEIHALGIDDHHFFVLSRDKDGITTHHLHGANSLDQTELLAAKKRSNLFASLAFIIVLLASLYLIDAVDKNYLSIIFISVVVFTLVRGVITIAGGSFDDYFKSMFNERLDSGEVIIIIDVERKQSAKVEKQLESHPLANFLADSSNFSSPIPE